MVVSEGSGESNASPEKEQITHESFMSASMLKCYGDAVASMPGARVEVLGSELSNGRKLRYGDDRIAVRVTVKNGYDLQEIRESVSDLMQSRLKEEMQRVHYPTMSHYSR